MKLAFSTAQVRAESFAGLASTAECYGFDGFEIADLGEAEKYADSIFSTLHTADAKRKLINRRLSVCALSFPEPVSDGEQTEKLSCLLDRASLAGVERIVLTLSETLSLPLLHRVLDPILPKAEKLGVSILLRTCGPLASTERVIDVLHDFRTTVLGAAWDPRATFFEGGETPEMTIRVLGAYIGYVSLGDRKDGNDVLIGEGDLPLAEVLDALRSLSYDGFLCMASGGGIEDPDLLLSYFAATVSPLAAPPARPVRYYNRARTGTFPWKKYDVIRMTFSQVLDTMVENYPDQIAFKYTTLNYTRSYRQFREDVDRTAAALISLGVKKGHHVAVWATNIPQWFITFWATVKIGAVLVTVNTAYKSHEAEYLLRQSDTHTLVMIENCKDSDYRAIMTELCPETLTNTPGEPLFCKKLPFLKHIVTCGFSMPGCLTWEDFLRRADGIPTEEVRRRASLVHPDDVANMQYTSGTTGFPKGVMLTHANIINNGKIIGDRMDLSTADRMMIQVPMFHCFGMVLSMTSMMTHGGTLSPLPYFSPKSSLACVTSEKITCFNGVPTMFLAMFNHEDFAKTDFSFIRTGIMAGANCPPELMRRAAAEMNMTEILSVYGQTESSPGCTMGEVNEDLDHRVDTVGSAFPGVECRIIDPETGLEVPDGVPGEFVARGFNIMKGYYKMPAATAKTIDAEGWLHTGDICTRTPDGYYKVTGRLKDMIIRGGENIYPREIEEFYLTHPKVKDVQVVGVPDKRYGEEACAYIIPKDGEDLAEDELRKYGEEHMARHKVPRYFVLTDAFPMNAAGKILKYKMKEDAEARFCRENREKFQNALDKTE